MTSDGKSQRNPQQMVNVAVSSALALMTILPFAQLDIIAGWKFGAAFVTLWLVWLEGLAYLRGESYVF